MNLHKIFKIIAGVLSLIGAVLLALIINTGDEAFESAYASGQSTALVDNMSYLAYLVLAIIILFVVFFVVKNLFTNTSSLKSTLVGVGAFLAVLLVSYFLTAGDPTQYFNNGIAATESSSHMVGAGLVAFYALGSIAILLMLFTGVKKLIK